MLTREEVVELADAVAGCAGIASGIGTSRYGAQLVVEAGSRDEAIELATAEFAARPPRPGRPAVRGRSTPGARPMRRGQDDDRDDGRRADDQARLAGRVPVRGAAGAGRLDPAGQPGRVRDPATSPSRTPSPTGTRSSTSATPRTCPPSASRSSTRARRAGCGGPGRGGRSTSAPTRCRAALPSHREQIARELERDLPAAAATTSSTTGPGRTSGSASTRRRPPPARLPAAARTRTCLRATASPNGPRLSAWAGLCYCRAEADRVEQPGPAGPGRRPGRARAAPARRARRSRR